MRNEYISNDELQAELDKWRASAEQPDDRQPSERLGQLLIDLHDGVLRHAHFCRYRPDIKEELKSFSLYRILKRGLKTFKFDGKSTPFAYFTRAIFLNYYTALGRYYRQLNAHQDYVAKCIQSAKDQGLLQSAGRGMRLERGAYG